MLCKTLVVDTYMNFWSKRVHGFVRANKCLTPQLLKSSPLIYQMKPAYHQWYLPTVAQLAGGAAGSPRCPSAMWVGGWSRAASTLDCAGQ